MVIIVVINIMVIIMVNGHLIQLARETNNQFWLANAEQLSVLETRWSSWSASYSLIMIIDFLFLTLIFLFWHWFSFFDIDILQPTSSCTENRLNKSKVDFWQTIKIIARTQCEDEDFNHEQWLWWWGWWWCFSWFAVGAELWWKLWWWWLKWWWNWWWHDASGRWWAMETLRAVESRWQRWYN